MGGVWGAGEMRLEGGRRPEDLRGEAIMSGFAFGGG
jgi:hypothetical protein